MHGVQISRITIYSPARRVVAFRSEFGIWIVRMHNNKQLNENKRKNGGDGGGEDGNSDDLHARAKWTKLFIRDATWYLIRPKIGRLISDLMIIYKFIKR